ncbi:MAG: glycerophosphodiester phosphodiesterase family protein [Aristaeellaceae bacterium]
MVFLLPLMLPWLYAWLIHPRWPRRDHGRFLGVNYAHRGLWHAHCPENSLSAFAAASARGYGMELDVHLTADGALVVHHDSSLRRMCGQDIRIERSSLEAIRACRLLDSGESVPTLAQALAAAGDAPLIVELKPTVRNAFRLSRAVHAQMQGYKGPWCVESFSPLALLWFRLFAPAVLRGQLTYNRLRDSGSLSEWLAHLAVASMLQNALSRPDFVACEVSGDTPGNLPLRWLRRMGTPMVGWTVRSSAAMQACRSRYAMVIFEHFLP